MVAELSGLVGGLSTDERRSAGWQVGGEPLRETVVGSARPALIVLSAAVLLVLLIAYANVAHLTLARGSSRTHELLIRRSVGASRSDLLRQVVGESLVVSTIGGVLGVFLAQSAVTLLVSLAPPQIPRLDTVGLNFQVVCVALALSIGSGLLAGLWPALRITVSPATDSLRSRRGSSGSASYHRLLGGIVTFQTAVSVVLLLGSGLLIRSFIEIQRVDPGFDSSGVIALGLLPPASRYADDAAVVAYYSSLMTRFDSDPAIQAVGIGSNLPLADRGAWMRVSSQEQIESGNIDPLPVLQRAANPTFFSALGVPLANGTPFDGPRNSRALQGVVINEVLADEFWPGENPVGRLVSSSTEPTDDQWLEVVGVIGNLHFQDLQQAPEPQLFELHDDQTWRPMFLFVRPADINQAGFLGFAEDLIREVDPSVPIGSVTPISDLLTKASAGERFNAWIFGWFGSVALVLTLAGLYGALSFAVTERHREIGLRMAVGAPSRNVAGLILSRGLRMVCGGLVLGLFGGWLLSRWVQGLLFGVSSLDLVAYVGALSLILITALLACYVPARRASRLNPATVLSSGT